MENIDDIPRVHAPPPETARAVEKKAWLYDSAYAIIDNFVMGEMDVTSKYHNGGKVNNKEKCGNPNIIHLSSLSIC